MFTAFTRVLLVLSVFAVLNFPREFFCARAFCEPDEISVEELVALIDEANAGKEEAVNSLHDLALRGNVLAGQALIAIAPAPLADRAARGDIDAVRVLGWLTYQTNPFAIKAVKEMNPAHYAQLAQNGDVNASHVLRYLCFLGNPRAPKALEEIDPALLINMTNTEMNGLLGPFRDHDPVFSLRELFVKFNLSNRIKLAEFAVPKVFEHANLGSPSAVELLRFFAQSGSLKAIKLLREVRSEAFDQKMYGRRRLMNILEVLAKYGNPSALEKMVTLQ